MKRLLTLFFVFLTTTAAFAQIKTYSDIETRTFVIGLDSYFFGDSGSLDFRTAGASFQARIEGGEVHVSSERGDVLLENGAGDTLVGVHDFTGDNQPELVVARRDGNALSARIYQLTRSGWSRIGRIGASGEGVSDIRVFRQAFSIRDKAADALYTWTWHASRFDFKASDGASDPTPEE